MGAMKDFSRDVLHIALASYDSAVRLVADRLGVGLAEAEKQVNAVVRLYKEANADRCRSKRNPPKK